MSLLDANAHIVRWMQEHPHIREIADSADTASLLSLMAAYGDERAREMQERCAGLVNQDLAARIRALSID